MSEIYSCVRASEFDNGCKVVAKKILIEKNEFVRERDHAHARTWNACVHNSERFAIVLE